MTALDKTVGIVGGSGRLGHAISMAVLQHSGIDQARYWVANRSGNRAGFETYKTVNVTTNNQTLADACDVIILCVPPSQFSSLSINASGKLLISVIAGVTIEHIKAATSAEHVVRAMSSPAAAEALAYSPWFASDEVTSTERTLVSTLLNACGTSDELDVEQHIELFTAMTGPVPGFVAFFAQCMSDFAITNGVSEEISNRATQQLFLGAATLMANGNAAAKDHVQAMIDYDGTTAAGLKNLKQSSMTKDIANGLMAAVEKTREIAS